MFKFFQDIRQHAASERTFKAVLELNKKRSEARGFSDVSKDGK